VRRLEIACAAESAEYATSNKITARKPVTFRASMSRSLPGGWLELSRFFVTRCAADAIAYSIKVDPAGHEMGLAENDWVHVKGRLTGVPGTDLSVAATALTRIAQPAKPYN
jgi:uncharacterized membrane protein YcgQ (UPF0703/DUF1980 family)